MNTSYTVIHSPSIDQVEKLYRKHMRFFVMWSYSHDQEDGDGYCTLYTNTGKKIEFCMRNSKPIYAEFTGFGDLRYDVKPEIHPLMYAKLLRWGLWLEKRFWKGGQI